MKEEFCQLLLNWYKTNARSLPWRGQPDPYAIWVSEIMLQQTRVETVIPYFRTWMLTFPDIRSLAEAEEDQVLKQWEGLGYYSRARTLQKAARVLVEKFNSKLPEEAPILEKLPGIGPYTAAAISSIAFGRDEAVLDGNVKRVLARVCNYSKPVNVPSSQPELRRMAQDLLPAGKAGDYNQAMMDLGATICTPRAPKCETCPVRTVCAAASLNLQSALPMMAKKPALPHWVVTAAVLRRDGKVLISKRPGKGLLGGLWEFPGGKMETGETREQSLEREIMEELGSRIHVGNLLGVYHHAYTHYRVTLYAFHSTIIDIEPRPIQSSDIRWVNVSELDQYPMGKIDRTISQDLQNEPSFG